MRNWSFFTEVTLKNIYMVACMKKKIEMIQVEMIPAVLGAHFSIFILYGRCLPLNALRDSMVHFQDQESHFQ